MFSSKWPDAILVAARMFVVAAGFVVTVGCGDGGYATPPTDTSEASSSEETPAGETTAAAAPNEGAPAAVADTKPAAASPAKAAPSAATAPAEENTERVVAETGVGVKGRTLDPGGIMTSSARALFRTKERLVFIQVEHAMNLFRATDGNFPKSHDQFMAQIIEANNIKLPELPAGAKYVYDPAKGELMVERPRR